MATFKGRYENFIGGEWVPPVKGQYFENPRPGTGQNFIEVARGTAEDVDMATRCGARRRVRLGQDVSRPACRADKARTSRTVPARPEQVTALIMLGHGRTYGLEAGTNGNARPAACRM